MGVLKTAAVAAGLVLAASPALAHVSVAPKAADAGSYQVLRFGVGHGCEATAATTALRIEIPPGVLSARPQPKPGWTLQIEHGGEDGKSVAAITWRGALPADQYDEFLVQVHLPARTGPLAFPAVQSCGAAEVRWSEPTPAAGERPKRPAPTVLLTPAAGAPTPSAGAETHHH
jgi:uncharacterized protein YcnI